MSCQDVPADKQLIVPVLSISEQLINSLLCNNACCLSKSGNSRVEPSAKLLYILLVALGFFFPRMNSSDIDFILAKVCQKVTSGFFFPL